MSAVANNGTDPVTAARLAALEADAVKYTTPKGYQQLTNAQLATVATLAVPSGAMRAVIQNNGVSGVRWRDDGGDPAPIVGSTQAVGARIDGGEIMDITTNLSALKFIREADGSVLDISYYG